SLGICCISVTGVWAWRGRNESGGATALADFESVHLKGRLVFLVFDSDAMTKPQVHQALARLKAFLESRGAHIKIVYLPHGKDGSKTGLDDYLAFGNNVDDLLALASDNLRPIPGHDQ